MGELVANVLVQATDSSVITFAAFGAALLSARGRWRSVRGLAVLVARVVACMLVSAVVNAGVDLLTSSFLSFHVQTVVSAGLYCALIRDLPWPKRVALASILASGWVYSASLTMVLWAAPVPYWVIRALYMLAVTIVVWVLDRWVMGPDAEVSPSFAVLMLAVCASGVATQMLLRATIASEFDSAQNLWNMLVCLGSQAADLVAYAMFALTVRNHNEQLRAKEERHSMELRLEALQAYRLSEQSLRELRHEVKNQYAYIRTLLARGDYEGAERFFGEMELRADPTLSLAASGNRAVDDVVNLEAAKAREAGVALDARLVVPPELPFDELDLCSLLTNLLDNAIEACAATGPDGAGAVVELRVTADVGQGALTVRVCNPCARAPRTDAEGRLVSSKHEPGHGHGTRIVRQIAEKYDGVAEFACADGTFEANVMLVLPAAGE